MSDVPAPVTPQLGEVIAGYTYVRVEPERTSKARRGAPVVPAVGPESYEVSFLFGPRVPRGLPAGPLVGPEAALAALAAAFIAAVYKKATK